ncbi:hypothetical protein, partial [Candidatus Binatus sp.]|uniref:hypothetical protein n=1 Tax=Candidatus Binatus sp. TaxID=2811406 RepID=UPI003C72D965
PHTQGQFYFGDARLRWVNIQPALTDATVGLKQTVQNRPDFTGCSARFTHKLTHFHLCEEK